MTLKVKTYNSFAVSVLKMVCAFYGVEYSRASQRTRLREVVKCRQVYYYLMRKYTPLSYAQIASHVAGGFDHATVIHGLRTVNNLIDTDRIEKANIETIEALMEELIGRSPDVTKEVDEVLYNRALLSVSELNTIIKDDPNMQGWRKYKALELISSMRSNLKVLQP